MRKAYCPVQPGRYTRLAESQPPEVVKLDPRAAVPRWSFLTNHFLVLVAIARNPDLRVRDIAAEVGVTERATQAILSDLVEAGFVERIRIGRRNRYAIRRNAGFRHPMVDSTTIGQVLDVLEHPRPRAASG